ncbi:MAG TPA: hypothetical protein VLA19_06625 [Herpetosiphonaceae bacterium]|nr:hypothetical protein [Herpetosiphonaceae bacterium]
MSDHDQPEDEYITAAAAGEILGVSYRQAMRYGAKGQIRTRAEGRRFMYHAGDVRTLAAAQQSRRQRVDSGATRSMSRPSEWKTKYEEANAAVISAAHRIGQLEQEVEQLRQEIARRPTPEAYAELQAKLQQLEAPRRWWKFWGK